LVNNFYLSGGTFLVEVATDIVVGRLPIEHSSAKLELEQDSSTVRG
jgi:hypothetical protein